MDVDNLPLETLDDEINDDEVLVCAKETLQIENKGKPKKRVKPRIIRSVWFNVKSQPEKHYRELISRAQPTLKLPCISPQSSVTCNGEYRRPVIKAQPSFHDVDAENGKRKLYVI